MFFRKRTKKCDNIKELHCLNKSILLKTLALKKIERYRNYIMKSKIRSLIEKRDQFWGLNQEVLGYKTKI